MKDDLAFKQTKSLRHTRAHFDIFNSLANWAVSEAGGKKKVFGEKPNVADYTPTDLGDEFSKAIAANIKNHPEIAKYLESILPGYGEMLKTGTSNTLALLRGEIPKDVQDTIRRSTAFKSLAGGYGGSPMSKALTARDFGRTSLDLTDAGTNAAQRWASIAEGANAPFTITGEQQAGNTQRNNLYKQATQQFKYNVEAAPDPGAAGTFNLQTALGSMAASFGMSSALGSMRGAGAGAGAAGSNGGQQYPYSAPYLGWTNEGRQNATGWGH